MLYNRLKPEIKAILEDNSSFAALKNKILKQLKEVDLVMDISFGNGEDICLILDIEVSLINVMNCFNKL